MDTSATINRDGSVMVSAKALRRLLSNAYQSEMVEEMLNDVIFERLSRNGYRLAGLVADCREINGSTVADCDGIIHLDRQHHCDDCGRKVNADQVADWIKKGIGDGTIVKSYSNMDTAQFWDDHWEEFVGIENANASELARMVGK